MVEYSVSLDIKTKQISLAELERIIGIKSDDEYSSDKDEQESEGVTYWRFFSDLSEKAALDEHVSRIIFFISSSDALTLEKRIHTLPNDCEYYLSIGIFFNEESEGNLAEIPTNVLKMINRYGLSLEMCLYPTNFE